MKSNLHDDMSRLRLIATRIILARRQLEDAAVELKGGGIGRIREDATKKTMAALKALHNDVVADFRRMEKQVGALIDDET